MLDRHLVEVAARPGEDDQHLIDHVHRVELRLLQDLDHAIAVVELLLRRGVEFGAELGERL